MPPSALFVKNLSYNVSTEDLFDLFVSAARYNLFVSSTDVHLATQGKFGPIRYLLPSYELVTRPLPNSHPSQPNPPRHRQQHQRHRLRRLRRCHGRQERLRQAKRLQLSEPLPRRPLPPARQAQNPSRPRRAAGELRKAQTGAWDRIVVRGSCSRRCEEEGFWLQCGLGSPSGWRWGCECCGSQS